MNENIVRCMDLAKKFPWIELGNLLLTILFSYFCLVDQFTAKLKSDFSLHSKDILLLQRSIFSMFGIN